MIPEDWFKKIYIIPEELEQKVKRGKRNEYIKKKEHEFDDIQLIFRL